MILTWFMSILATLVTLFLIITTAAAAYVAITERNAKMGEFAIITLILSAWTAVFTYFIGGGL